MTTRDRVLLACLRCGGADGLHINDDYDEHSVPWFFVECVCGESGPQCCDAVAAAEAWNAVASGEVEDDADADIGVFDDGHGHLYRDPTRGPLA